jgi:hypothetical protein
MHGKADPEFVEEVEHPGRLQSRDGEHFQNAGRHLRAHSLETRYCALLVEALDRLREGDPHAWDLPKPPLGDHLAKPHIEQQKALGRASIGTSLLRVVPGECEPLPELHQQRRDRGCIEFIAGPRSDPRRVLRRSRVQSGFQP